nr:Chain C, peptide SER-TRP-PHE-GLN-THR-ASP-LEU [synthetic construct]4WYU_D Chain D, peptide SER-TRP-PHE-GLN-THR-ASP-LEU [synthetic construct]
SWFQTDL